MIRAPIDIPHEPDSARNSVSGCWYWAGHQVAVSCPVCDEQHFHDGDALAACYAELGHPDMVVPMTCKCGLEHDVRLADWATAGKGK